MKLASLGIVPKQVPYDGQIGNLFRDNSLVAASEPNALASGFARKRTLPMPVVTLSRRLTNPSRLDGSFSRALNATRVVAAAHRRRP